MVVVCNISGCPYRNLSGFCKKPVIGIDEAGRCKHIYRGDIWNPHWKDPVEEWDKDDYWKTQEVKDDTD